MERKRFSNPLQKSDPPYLLPKTPYRPAVAERMAILHREAYLGILRY